MTNTEKILTAVVVVLIVAVAALGWQWKTTSDKWDETKVNLSSVKGNLEDTTDDLESTQAQLSTTQDELESSNWDLSEAQGCVDYIMNDMLYKDMGKYGVLLPKSSLQGIFDNCNPSDSV